MNLVIMIKDLAKLEQTYNLFHRDRVELPPAKRLFDIVISLKLLALFSPILLVILIAYGIEMMVVQSSRGSLLYREPRISGGKVFAFIKFRTFKQSAIDTARLNNHVVHTKELEGSKTNFTRTGYVLNKLYLDELPQLLCVLKGDMTLVGPRPTNVEVTAQKRAEKDYTKDFILSGLTGPYQSVKGEKGFDQRSLDEDYIEFVRGHSGLKVLLKDIQILLRTIKVFLKAQGI